MSIPLGKVSTFSHLTLLVWRTVISVINERASFVNNLVKSVRTVDSNTNAFTGSEESFSSQLTLIQGLMERGIGLCTIYSARAVLVS